MVPPTHLLYRVIHIDTFSFSRACLWKMLQPDPAEPIDRDTSLHPVGRETHCCQDHRPLSTVKGRLLFRHNYKAQLVSSPYNQQGL